MLTNRVAKHLSGWSKPARAAGPSLMTTLGVVSGEVLTCLEEHGTTSLRRVIRELAWPSQLVVMAVGALVRDGLVRAEQHDLEVLLEPGRTWRLPAAVRAAALAGQACGEA